MISKELRAAYVKFFQMCTGFSPYACQIEMVESADSLSAGTGMGKTEAAVLGWFYRHLFSTGEPPHLVYVLPTRSLVNQVVAKVEEWFKLYQEATGKSPPSVYKILGGLGRKGLQDGFLLEPEKPWVLIGTLDQIHSRRLGRGYMEYPSTWGMSYGILNNNCRYVYDETQAMGAGFQTAIQLDILSVKLGAFNCPPSIYMSATLDPTYLNERLEPVYGRKLRHVKMDAAKEQNPEAKRRILGTKPLRLHTPPKALKYGDYPVHIAQMARKEHIPGTLTLVMPNTVKEAQAIYLAIPAGVPKLLLHSQLCPEDRAKAEKALKDFEILRKASGGTIPDNAGLICVSTQVLNAGIDVTADKLLCEGRPWCDAIQSLGKLNRDGCSNERSLGIFWMPKQDKEEDADKTRIGPYLVEQVDAFERFLKSILKDSQCKPFQAVLEDFYVTPVGEEARQTLVPVRTPIPRVRDIYELYGCEENLTGSYPDISSWIRSSDPDMDAGVFYREWSTDDPNDDLTGKLCERSEVCSVPTYRLRDFLGDATPAYTWDSEEERWVRIRRVEDIHPGMTVMVHAKAGGYSRELGFTGDAKDKRSNVGAPGWPSKHVRDELGTEESWVTVQGHLNDTEARAKEIVAGLPFLPPDYAHAVVVAAAKHDIGKTYPRWGLALLRPADAADVWYAKAPRDAISYEPTDQVVADRVQAHLRKLTCRAESAVYRDNKQSREIECFALNRRLTPKELADLRSLPGVKTIQTYRLRSGVRHEAASGFALWHEYRTGKADYPALTVYFAMDHHGKVHSVLKSRLGDGNDALGIRFEDHVLPWNDMPMDFTIVGTGCDGSIVSDGYMLKGPGWSDVVISLLGSWRGPVPSVLGPDEPNNLGPFKLGYLLALVRVSDWTASANPTEKRHVR